MSNTPRGFSGGQYGNSPDDSGQIITKIPEVGFDVDDTPGPGAQYVDENDFLMVAIFSNLTNKTFTINWRILTPGGKIEPGQVVGTSTNGRTGTLVKTPMREGFLLSVSIVPQSDGANQTYFYATAGLLRFATSQANWFATLCKGYCTQSEPLFWPGGQYQQSEEGPGCLRTITGSVPAAGADINEAVPQGARWRLLSLSATLTTAVAVANRQVQLTLDNAGTAYYATTPGPAQAASLVWTYCFAPTGYAPLNTLLTVQSNYDNQQQLDQTNGHIRTLTNLIQAADQWSAPTYTVLEWQAKT